MNELRYRRVEEALFADAGLDPIERWIDLPSIGTRARVLETGEGPPVLFLHGGPMAAATGPMSRRGRPVCAACCSIDPAPGSAPRR